MRTIVVLSIAWRDPSYRLLPTDKELYTGIRLAIHLSSGRKIAIGNFWVI